MHTNRACREGSVYNERNSMKSPARGFSLIELLVVIAIIAVLSTVVLASLNTARQKGRDAKRISEIKTLQLALDLYYDANGVYPSTIGTTGSSVLVSGGFIAALPVDPLNGNVFNYRPYAASGNTTTCVGYHMGVSLEISNHSSLRGDADTTSLPAGTVICNGGSDFIGSDAGKCATTDAGVACYDVKS
jgi:prepilin-type N-terminal cleavage/methylation domain-containing protein